MRISHWKQLGISLGPSPLEGITDHGNQLLETTWNLLRASREAL